MIKVVDYMSYRTIVIKKDINNIENVTKEMLQYQGKSSKIILKVEDFETNKIYYLLEIDNCNNIWTNEMIEVE